MSLGNTASKPGSQRNNQEWVKPEGLFGVSVHRIFLYTSHLFQGSLQSHCSEYAFPRSLRKLVNGLLGGRVHHRDVWGIPHAYAFLSESINLQKHLWHSPHTQIKGWKSSLWTTFLARMSFSFLLTHLMLSFLISLQNLKQSQLSSLGLGKFPSLE